MYTLTFRTLHNYSPAATGIEIPITLGLNGSRAVRLLANVDTGASFCTFQREYAEHLGIDVESGLQQRVATAAGAFDAYGHRVVLSCLDWE